MAISVHARCTLLLLLPLPPPRNRAYSAEGETVLRLRHADKTVTRSWRFTLRTIEGKRSVPKWREYPADTFGDAALRER